MAPHDDGRFSTLSGLLERQAARTPHGAFAIFPDAIMTYGEALARASELAKGLIALGLKPAEHVAILAPNCQQFLLAHFAAQLAGGRSVLMNARFKQHELSQVLGPSDARILIIAGGAGHADYMGVLAAAFPELETAPAGGELAIVDAPSLRRLVVFGAAPAPALSDERLVELGRAVSDTALAKAHANQDPEETAVLIYTSGTTAAPKACELSHASLQRSWRLFTDAVDLGEGEKVWDPMPFFHSGGIGMITGVSTRGATLLTTPYFDPDLIAGLCETHEVEHLYPGFHTVALPVLRSPNYDRTRWSRFVKTMVNCGPLGTQQVIRDLLPAGVPIMNLFGMSESSGLLTLAPPDAPEAIRLESSGRPARGAEVRIVDPATLEDLAPGAKGEIVFRGAGAFRGYYGNPAATARTILADGWVRTGDLGRFDEDGWLFFLGRLKDVLKVGGENVAATELEGFLSGHPAVKFVQVVGKPDDHMGEVPVAFVELNAQGAASEAEIIAYCRGRIASYKIPRRVIFVTEWPMSSTKIQKFKLVEQLAAMED